MKVLAIVHGYLPTLAAGSERMLQHMLRPLVAAGHEVVLWSLDDDTEGVRDVEGVTVFSGAQDHRCAPDVIITHHEHGARHAAFVAAMNPAAKRIAIYHNERYFIETLLAFQPDLHVFNTQWVAEAVAAKYGPLAGSKLVVHPPLEPERHRVAASGRAVTLVNLSANKGVSVFAELVRRMPDVQFLGVQGTHGTQDYCGGQNVTFMATQQDMREVWRRTAVLLVPSGYESYGMVAAEACVSGVPAVASPTPGLQECLGDAGTYVDVSDVDSWEAEVRRLIGDTSEYERASKAARARADELVSQTEIELATWLDTVEWMVSP